ncbi:anaerobic ribonucleoside-triphosphate reductase activating protein [archaeon]|nr:anaerobic ribonucleoside-triphosphate reductase activating protein [archaeon]
MKIKFIQRTTLVDFPGQIACTIFNFGCPFRCGFCYNPELVLKEETPDLDETKILNFLEKRKNQLTGVCFTGGEPLVDIDLELLKKIKVLGFKIKIDTNGSFPDKLKEIIDLGLVDYVAMDIKNSKENYLKTINVDLDLTKIERSMELVSSLQSYEFRTTIVEDLHSLEDLEKMFIWASEVIGKKIRTYSLQGFKNFGKFVDESYSEKTNTTFAFLEEVKKIAEKYCGEVVVKH